MTELVRVPFEGESSALGRSAFAWGWRRDQPNDKYFLSINNVPDTLWLDMYAGTHWVAPAGLEACLRGIESIIVEATLDLAHGR